MGFLQGLNFSDPVTIIVIIVGALVVGGGLAVANQARKGPQFPEE
jgi:hypothetical protein